MSITNYPTLPPPAARAAAGALFLDQVQPDWMAHVDERILDINSNDRCVLGQLGLYLDPATAADPQYAYQVAIDAYDLDIDQLFLLGFTDEALEAPSLTFAWTALIAGRRAVHVHHIGQDDDLVVAADLVVSV